MLPLPLLKKKKIKQEMILLHILQYYKSNLIINTIKKKSNWNKYTFQPSSLTRVFNQFYLLEKKKTNNCVNIQNSHMTDPNRQISITLTVTQMGEHKFYLFFK